MNETNTVTITIEEYFDLRHKAEMNSWLMTELGELRERMFAFDNRLFELETKVKAVD